MRMLSFLVKVSPAVMDEVKRIVTKSEIIEEDDSKWPEPNTDGRQELEILLDNKHIFFTVVISGLFITYSVPPLTRW